MKGEKKTQLSKTMRDCYEYAKGNGGILTRFPGSFHQPVKWMLASQERQFFGSSTVEALVKRGYAEYSKWRMGRRGEFPIEVTMKDKDLENA